MTFSLHPEHSSQTRIDFCKRTLGFERKAMIEVKSHRLDTVADEVIDSLYNLCVTVSDPCKNCLTTRQTNFLEPVKYTNILTAELYYLYY